MLLHKLIRYKRVAFGLMLNKPSSRAATRNVLPWQSIYRHKYINSATLPLHIITYAQWRGEESATFNSILGKCFFFFIVYIVYFLKSVINFYSIIHTYLEYEAWYEKSILQRFALWAFRSLWHWGTALFKYCEVWAKFAMYVSLILGLVFLENNFLLVGSLMR